MTNTWVLLLRGINVNPSTRLAMADLRSILEDEGLTGVRTILQSGNVLADAPKRPDATRLSSAITSRSGVKTSGIVLSESEIVAVSEANPLRDVSDDLSKMVITFFDSDIVPRDVTRPSEDELGPERLVLAKRAIYQWCPDGVTGSKLPAKFWRQFTPIATARNVRTVDRLIAALEDEHGARGKRALA